MENKHINTTNKHIDIALGYENDIAEIFQFGKNDLNLVDVITFIFNQTLKRDMFFGSWAQAYINGNGEYRLKITSPTDDVSSYKGLIKDYIAAGKKALYLYYEQVYKTKGNKNWEFLLPFGLAMANVKSIQLLHFPPLETFTYRDYLYSPTNRRWECLLAQNASTGTHNSLLERIIDIAPIAAPGGDGKEINQCNTVFIDYVKAQLNTFLKPQEITQNKYTQPVIAYGKPVRQWLKEAYKLDDIPKNLEVVELNLLKNNSTVNTWILCANHPSEYLYDCDLPLKDATKRNGFYPAPIEVMCQDLIAAGWQAHMSKFPNDDPHITLKVMQDRWGWEPTTKTVKKDKVSVLKKIMAEQNTAFNLKNNSFTPTKAQTQANVFAIQRDHTNKYSSYAIDPTAENILSEVDIAKYASIETNNRLIQAGGYIIKWKPAKSDDDVIEYTIFKYQRNSGNPFAEKTIAYGKWEKDKFFSHYRPNYGANYSDIELIGFPGYVLSIIPASGRRSYQLWSFDPLAEHDCLSEGHFKSGGFPDISADRELYTIGNYVLDRKGSHYRVWSFDPQSTPPLALPNVQEGNWETIDNTDHMATLGNYIITWKPDDLKAGYRLWWFNATQLNPLGNKPISTSNLPHSFNKHTRLFGVTPSSPQNITQENTPGTMPFMRKEIKHIVYYMVESRSFDNVLGWLYKKGKKNGLHWIGNRDEGFRGLDKSMYNKMPNGEKAHVTQYRNGKLSNEHILGGPAQDPWHDNSDILMQMFHGYQGYKDRNQPTMDGFAWNQNSSKVLSSFTPEQLPILNGLAENFGVSDDWFSSIPGGTDVNRGFSVSGSAYNRLATWEGGSAYKNWPDEAHRQSLWKVLWNHGHKDWKIYYKTLWKEAVFTYQLYLKGQISEVDTDWTKALSQIEKPNELPNSKWISPMEQFHHDIDNNNLPRFSYIEPAWVGEKCTSYHPGSTGKGIASLVPAEQALNDIYEKLSKNSDLWEKTLLVITSDKSGGLYDHVPPHYTNKPWPNDVTNGFEFDIMGPRVPAIFASPWIKPNTVMRSSDGKGFDSTSFAATLLEWYSIERNTWGLGDRMQNAQTIEKILNEKNIKDSKTPPIFTPPYDKLFPKKG